MREDVFPKPPVIDVTVVRIKDTLQNWLQTADVCFNGGRPWDIQVHNPRLYRRILVGGSMAAGESYMDGWWDSESLDETFTRILKSGINQKVNYTPSTVWNFVVASLRNLQSTARAFQIGERHYDTGNELFRLMLDKRMVYSCGYWREAKNLDDAQEAKLDLVCRKLHLREGQKVLDIGCGWGSFARYAAKNYGVRVVGLTVSKRQAELAQEKCEGLPVEIRLQDYREISEPFDRVVSIGMFEHVGKKNYRTFMEVAHRCLKEDGLQLLHCIGSNISVNMTDPWIHKYIFRNGMIPSAQQITKASEGLFIVEDWHNFGPFYDNTLMAWYHNFTSNWDKLQDRYDSRFYRMWTYYLLVSAASFRARKNQLWQIVLSKKGTTRHYQSVR